MFRGWLTHEPHSANSLKEISPRAGFGKGSDKPFRLCQSRLRDISIRMLLLQ